MEMSYSMNICWNDLIFNGKFILISLSVVSVSLIICTHCNKKSNPKIICHFLSNRLEFQCVVLSTLNC